MAILLIAWLAAALVLVAIDLRARLTGQPAVVKAQSSGCSRSVSPRSQPSG